MSPRPKPPACSSLGRSGSNTNVSKIICFLALNQAQKTTLVLLIFDPNPLIEAQKETHSCLGLRHPPGKCQRSNLLRLMSDLAKEFKARVRGALSEGREGLQELLAAMHGQTPADSCSSLPHTFWGGVRIKCEVQARFVCLFIFAIVI